MSYTLTYNPCDDCCYGRERRDGSGNDAICKICEFRALLNPRASGWIGVDEWLPEQDTTLKFYRETHMELTSVLACGYSSYDSKKPYVREVNRILFKATGVNYIDKAITPIGVWHWSRCFERVTHWMPLPAPPESEAAK